MRIVVAGGRFFGDWGLLCSVLDAHLAPGSRHTILSGMAKGADLLGERYSVSRGHTLWRFPAKWRELGKGAGHIRNAEMADNADMVFVFWDGRSAGSRNMIEAAHERGLPVLVTHYSS